MSGCVHGGTEEICHYCDSCHDCDGVCPWAALDMHDELLADMRRDER